MVSAESIVFTLVFNIILLQKVLPATKYVIKFIVIYVFYGLFAIIPFYVHSYAFW